ncbi:MAG: GerMN domain-containing protein [Bacillota bacterium]
MKKFLCLMVVLGLTFFYGCQIPVDNIEDNKTDPNPVSLEPDIQDSKADLKNRDKSTYENNEDIEKSENSEKENSTALESVEVAVCYRDSEGMIIPITRKIEKQEGIAKAVLRSMVDNEENNLALKPFGLYTVLPQGTDILGMNIKEGTAVVDFNDKVLEYNDKSEEKNIITSIVYSLTEFNTINSVKILVKGKQLEKLKYGTDISGDLNRDNILINSDKANLAEKVKKVDIYLFKFINEKFEYILPVSMEYIGVQQDKLPEEMIRLLSGKTYNEKLYSQMPPKVELISSKLEDGVLILNFNKEIRNYGGNAREAGILKQIIYTMKQIEGVKKIKILIEGKEGELPEGTDISREILLPTDINVLENS